MLRLSLEKGWSLVEFAVISLPFWLAYILLSSADDNKRPWAEEHAAPQLTSAKESSRRGDVVIAYPNGSFLVVRCSQELQDELFFNSGFSRFHASSTTEIYKTLTFVLIQFFCILYFVDIRSAYKAFWAGAYATTVYSLWILVVFSERLSWGSSCFTTTQEHIMDGNEDSKLVTTGEYWTEALWKTIAISQSTDWVDEIVASPTPTGWREWLSAAEAHAATVQSRTIAGDDGLEIHWKLPIWDASIQREQRLLEKEPTPRIPRKSREQMPNEPSNTPRIWGRPTWFHLLGETITRRMEKIRRSAVPQGYKRICWTCSCGDEMYGDYDNFNPAAVDAFASRLQQYNQTSQGTSSATNTGQNPNNTQVSSPDTNSTSIQTPSVSSGPVGAANTVQSSSTAATSSGSSSPALSTLNQNPTKAKQFFELCVNIGELDVRLGETEVTNVTSDADLFQAIYRRYKEIRGHRMQRIFLKPVNINYVQFNVRERHRVGIYQAPLAIPPEAEVYKGNYHYQECPLQVKPPMDYRTFLHYMHKHKDGDVHNPSGINLTQDAIFLERLPKKMKTSILPSSKAEMKFGWGVHIIEGPNKVALGWMTFLALALSFVVSALYAHFWHTQEQGFAIGQWLVAVLTAAMAALYFQWADT
ncbi:hypothetical protein FB567DRAFT_593168 [Paraphoma chrysanthemicola]|uniref:Uncharacterized protein n=1 Tax=Paraphoma chrysanthemicola TaxID=798071 RepID=A0A8K0R3C2_9PLEO|nr:hypothetical protein FB567DRAFT_593168 [Paraphoma chrysanthemicola]